MNEISPEAYVRHFIDGNPVYNDLLKPGVRLEGEFDGAFFTLKMHLSPKAQKKSDFKALKTRAEHALAETCCDINFALLETLQAGLTETFDEETVKTELRTRRFTPDGCYTAAEGENAENEFDDDAYTHQFDQLDAALQAETVSNYYEYLSGLNWWSAYITPWEFKLQRMGFINPEVTFDGKEGLIEECYFCSEINFETWVATGQFEPLNVTGTDDPGYISESGGGFDFDKDYEDYANEILEA